MTTITSFNGPYKEANTLLPLSVDPVLEPIHTDNDLPPNTENSEELVSGFDWQTSLCITNLGTVNVTFATSGAYGTLASSSLWLNLPHRGRSDSDEFHLPGFPDSCRFHINQLHHFLRNADGTDSWSKFFQSQFSLSMQSFGWLCNTAEEFEPAGLEWLRNFQTSCLGYRASSATIVLKNDYSSLSVAASGISTRRAGKKLEISIEKCMEWLESHSPASSAKPFIWVIRPPVGFEPKSEFRAEYLPEGFEERMEKRKQDGLWPLNRPIIPNAGGGDGCECGADKRSAGQHRFEGGEESDRVGDGQEREGR
ncbi:hypothetical protein POTOM_053784 [Populus tomentosa]|uniref:Uncharacterized protein n=1 Tax=Populus tomentosa TaxID=118781 RepID=A0A8X7XYL9_POPTO|nr:hypothetical protein POTOM_053784 [Populus tomentosa]